MVFVTGYGEKNVVGRIQISLALALVDK